MIARTAVRRSAVLGLGALGALALATPASALGAGGALAQVTDPAGVVVDLLLTPLDPVLEQLPPPVAETVAAVEEAVAPGGTPPSTPADPGPQGGGDPQPVPGPPADDAAAQPGPAAPAPAAPADNGVVTATSVGGTGFAASPGSIVSLDRIGMLRAGTGIAANPMSLFGAPQVALPPVLESGAVTAPQVFTPAGGALPELIPVGTPESVPGYLAALAATVVAAAAAAHVAALRSRRVTATA